MSHSYFIFVTLIKKVYKNPWNAGLILKKFPRGRKYAILEQCYNIMIFSVLALCAKKQTTKYVTNNAI